MINERIASDGGVAELGPEKRTFESKRSVLFKIRAADNTLRALMSFIATEGIITQNTESESRAPGAKDRLLHIWVDVEDEDKINKWLREQSFNS